MQPPQPSISTRRQFITNSTAALTAAAIASSAIQSVVYAGSSDTIKIGLVGCGGRGTGAAANALGADTNAKLVALGDMFKDQFDIALSSLKRRRRRVAGGCRKKITSSTAGMRTSA